MNNKIKYILILLASAFILIRCNDTLSLEEKPETFISEAQFFQNADDAEAAVGAALQSFQDFGYYQFRFNTGQFLASDIGAGRGHLQPMGNLNCDQACLDRYMWHPWASMYQGINRANLALAKLPEIDMSESRKEVLMGQLYFIRALNYLNLVRNWGGVPLRLEHSEGFENLAKPRATKQQVYDQIISDLELAESSLPVDDINGRPTRWAATTLLAYAYLDQEQWSQAADKAEEVINSGLFSLVEVNEPDDFDLIFGPEVSKSSEEIFDIPFRRQVPFGMHHPAIYHHPNAGYAGNAFRGIWIDVDAPWIANWDKNDLRYTFNLYTGADTAYLNPAEPQRPKKFKDPLAADRLGHGNDFPVLRYADALLIFAEAKSQAEGGPTLEAYEAVNQVRRRAYGKSLLIPDPTVDLPQGLNAEDFRDRIIEERAWEFLIESKRLWDLKRTGKLEEAVTAAGKTYDPKWMLWPIPQEEIDANEALTIEDQNPGW